MLKIGSVIDGKYKVLHQIGKGGMSTVYLAINEKVNKQWAVKEVKKYSRTSNGVVTQNPLNENTIMRKLHHPHLPSIIDIIDQDDTFLIIMDYVEGRTLKAILDEKGALPQDQVVDYAIQLCTVLSYLHHQNPKIIYRDMKPANVMLKPDGNVVLIDFGTAREYKKGNIEDTVCLGTRGYAAPEQYGGIGQTDERTDVYNLGVTIYQLVTGKNPTKPPYEIRPIREWDQGLSSGLEAIVTKCTKSNPEERYQTAEELKFALEHYRELEIEYQASKKKAIQWFASMCILSVVMFGVSIGSHAYASTLRSGTYAEKLRRAEISAVDHEKMEAYEYAIKLDPTRSEAYDELLNNVFLGDGQFDTEESDEIIRLLGYKGNGDTKTVEDRFAENAEGYDKFCFDLGLAYFYYYGDNGNKQLSKPWFSIAKDSQTLSPEKKERAKRFYQISDYYVKLGNRNKAGDNEVSYKDYWNDLVILSAGNIAAEDNVKTALVIYKELTYQINVHALEFKNAGVTREEMTSELLMAEKMVEEIKASDKYSETEDSKITEQIESNITNAPKVFDTVFGETGEEGGSES